MATSAQSAVARQNFSRSSSHRNRTATRGETSSKRPPESDMGSPPYFDFECLRRLPNSGRARAARRSTRASTEHAVTTTGASRAVPARGLAARRARLARFRPSEV